MSTKRSYSTIGGSQADHRPVKKSNAMPRYRSTSAGVNSNSRGVVGPKFTNLGLQKGPFPAKRWVSFEYSNALAVITSASPLYTISVSPNDMYDFDKTGDFGNKQPLYFDSLMSSTGPYKNYYVDSWVTTYTIINTLAIPITVWAPLPVSSSTEIDTKTEVDNLPGVQRLYLTAANGSKCIGTVTVKGHVKDVYPTFSKEVGLTGNYGASPTLGIFQGLVIGSADGSTNIGGVIVAVKHVAHTELAGIDALVS